MLRAVFGRGFGADAASAREVTAAKDAGLGRDEIYFSAPGKTLDDIRETMRDSVLIADSEGELGRIQTAAEEADIDLDTGIRINPDFTFTSEGGQASKFGIDEDRALELMRDLPYDRLRITGIHVHIKSQELDAGALASYHEKMFRLAGRVSEALGRPLDFINMGSGLGITYAEDDVPLDIESLGVSTQGLLEKFREAYPGTKVLIESGRYVSGKSGIYVTKVLDRKVSRGKTYIILKNTLNGFIRPSLEKMAEKYSPEEDPAPYEPLFTKRGSFPVWTLRQSGPEERVTLAGNLCTAADLVAEGIMMPRLEPGDLVCFSNAGAYSAVISPKQFSFHEPPAELFLKADGTCVTGASD